MKKLILKPQFVLLLSEITFLCELPANAPDTELPGLDKRRLGNIYYKYFGSLPISEELIANETKQKWPGGERRKVHECQRIILEVLHKINSIMPNNAELIPQPNHPDLTWLHKILTQATINEIHIIALSTDVVLDVPVADRSIQIMINDKTIDATGRNKIGFGRVVGFAFPDAQKLEGVSVTYTTKDGKITGYLTEGKETDVIDGMLFTVTAKGL